MKNTSKNQGEGNRDADQDYRERTRKFIDAGRVEEAASDAVNVPASERRELDRARREAQDRAFDLPDVEASTDDEKN